MAQRRKLTDDRSRSVMALAVATALLAASGAVNASVITANSDIWPGTYVLGSAPISGNFDISSSLTGMSVVFASITASFVDNSDSYQYSGSTDSGYYANGSNSYFGYSNSYCCGWHTCYSSHNYTDYYYQKNVVAYYSDPSEGALLTVGGATVGATSPYFNLGSSYSSSSTNAYWYGDGYNRYTDNYYSNHSGYTGPFSASLGLNPTALADLEADGLLGFTIGGYGNFLVSGVTLTVELAAIPSRTQDVPEPGSAALIGLALVGLGVAKRRSRQQDKG